ncbi:thioredoxin family protein [Cohnella kolymensis]|uniref:thioredoxin family protein n=1 Tax=Cohnella kolymensis TaxID=1590652 RepID=UPI000B3357EB|nr:thioredoxin family protein [Cohnella kolymensis]
MLNSLQKNTVYGKPADDLYPATKEILNDPNYDKIILPEQLLEKLDNKESFFVYYFASDCPHCKRTTPQIKPIADDLGINMHQFNLLEFDEYFGKMNIDGTPTLVYYKEGVESDRMSGGIAQAGTSGYSPENFKAFFEKHKPEGND